MNEREYMFVKYLAVLSDVCYTFARPLLYDCEELREQFTQMWEIASNLKEVIVNKLEVHK